MNEKKGDYGTLNIAHYFLFILIAGALFFCYRMMSIYLDAIIFALLLAVLMNPVYRRILKHCRNNAGVAAGISCLILTLLVLVPLSLMGMSVLKQGIRSIAAINQWIRQGNLETLTSLPLVVDAMTFVKEQLSGTGIDLTRMDFQSILLTLSTHAGELLVSQGGNLFGNITSMIGQGCLTLFVFFFVIQDQQKIADYILHLMPLSRKQESILSDKVKAVAKSAVVGTLVTCAAQGMAGGIAFAICGIPGIFWGTVMAFASLIPLVGTALIWIPAAGYLFLSGSIGLGIFLVIWCIVVVGMLDNIVRPLFMRGSAQMGTLVIFFAILGGINLFGITGILYGPLVVGVTMVLLSIYDLEFRSFLDNQDRN